MRLPFVCALLTDYLIKKGAFYYLMCRWFDSLVKYCFSLSSFLLLGLLLQHGCPADVGDSSNNTVAHYAVSKNQPNISLS